MANEFKAKNGVITPTVQSTVTTGTAPFTVASTTAVTNLNADLLDGNHASAFATASHNHDSTYVNVSGDTMTGALVVPAGTAAAPSLSFSSDTNTGIYSSAADTLDFSTGGTQKVSINASGTVRINSAANNVLQLNDTSGTPFPYVSFHRGGTRYGYIYQSATEMGLWNEENTPISFGVNNTTRMQLNNSGLAVGDYLSAAYPFEVWKYSDGIISRFARGNGTNNPRLEVSAVEATKTLTLDATGSTTPNLEIKMGGTARMAINTTGQVGIGTSPNSLAALNVEGVNGWTTSGWYKSIRLPQSRAIQFTGSTKHYGVGASGDEFYIFTTTAEDGSASANYIARFYTSGQFGIPAQYSNTTAGAANAFVDSLGIIYRSTSSIKYKTQVEDLDPTYADKLLDFRPVWYRSTCEKDRSDWSYYGFIAEELAAIEPRFVEYKQNEDGTLEPEGVQYSRIVVPLVALVQKQQQQINDLMARVAALEGQMS